MLLYAITDSVRLAAQTAERATRLAKLAAGWASVGVDFIQVREKDLKMEDLTSLSRAVIKSVRKDGGTTKVLVNAKPEAAIEVALASGADGVHLAGGLSAGKLSNTICAMRKELPEDALVSVSCHSVEEVAAARSAGATLVLFGPVFEKVLPDASTLPGAGLGMLSAACRAGVEGDTEPRLSVLALGGITAANAAICLETGAAGIASIRLFLGEGGKCDWRKLRA